MVEVKLFRELQTPNLVVAGENSVILERLAESLPWRLMLLNTGSLRGRIYLEDGVADLAAISRSRSGSRPRRHGGNKGL